MENIPAAKS